MKCENTIVAVSLISSLLFGCDYSDNKVKELSKECDSLRQAKKIQDEKLDNYGRIIETLNATLDSIAFQEQMLFVNNGDKPVTKEDVQQNLMRYEALIKKQGDRINQLEKQLTESNEADENSLSLIAHLKVQLNEKNVYIAQLKEELEKKNVNIALLQEQVESQKLTINAQSATISELNKRTQKQSEALARQDAILNNAYVLIGSKDDLKRKGILKKGKIVADASLDRSKFAKIDIRKWREVNFAAKRPRILTNMPASSYEITTTGNRNFTLTVKNPSDFWRISSYLIIQTD